MIIVLSTFTIINTFKLFFRMWKLHSIESLHSWTFTTFGTDSTLYLATTDPIGLCEAVLYLAILIVSAVLYSEIIDSITGL